MPGRRRFRILMPDGRLSHDRFFVAAEQPAAIMAGCLLVIHERSGTTLTVPDTQLFPAEAARLPPLSRLATTACLTRGKLDEAVEAGDRSDAETPSEPVILELSTAVT